MLAVNVADWQKRESLIYLENSDVSKGARSIYGRSDIG